MQNGSKRGPSLRRHKRSGNGYAKFNGRQLWFGPFDDPETHSQFAVFKAEWEANGRRIPSDELDKTFSVADLVARYLDHAQVYYRRPDGTPTHEIENIRYTARPLLELFATKRVGEFNLRALKLVRETMIGTGLSRGTVNHRIWRILRMFAWGVEEEHVAPEVYGALRALRPLKRGRSRAPETAPVRAVAWEDVEPVLEHVVGPVRAMILLQWYTAMRPGEVVSVRSVDIDRSGKVWEYRPERHKTEHHGIERFVAIGPGGQEAIRPYLFRVPPPAPDEPLFSPREAMAERHARARQERKTPLWPSHRRAQAKKRRAQPKKVPSEAYTVGSYRRAIKRGCDAAGVDPWAPNQLRHAAATRIRKELGLDAARVVLGHRSAAMTEVYAELDKQKALRVMEELG